MASKGQKFQKISKEQGLKLGTVLTIIHKYNQKGYVEKDKQGRIKETNVDYKERYELLKKFQAFLKEQQEKR